MPLLLPFAELGAFVTAVLLLLFLRATQPVWEKVVSGLVSELPVIGGAAGRAVSAITEGLFVRMAGWVNSGVGPFSQTIVNLATQASRFPAETVRALYWAHDRLQYLVQSWIPAHLHALQTEYYILYGWAVGAAHSALATAEAELGALRGWAAAELDQLRAWTTAELSQLAQATGAALRQLQAEGQAGLHLVQSQLQALIGESEARAIQREQTVKAEALAAVAVLGGQDARALDQLRKEAAAEASSAEVRANAAANQEIARAAATAAAATAAVALAVKAIKDSPCQQRCSTLGNLGGELEALELGLLLAGLAVLVRDPKPAADAVVSRLAPDFQAAVRTLAGVVRAA